MRIAHRRGEPGTSVVQLYAVLDLYLCLVSKEKVLSRKVLIRCKIIHVVCFGARGSVAL